MRVLLINQFFTPIGGAENSTWKTACLLRDYGHEVFFFATDKKPYFEPDYKYADFFPKFENLKEYESKKSYLHKIRIFFKILYNFEAERNLDRLIKEIKPNIIHINDTHYLLSSSVIRACYKNNVPMVMTLRSPAFCCPGGTLMYQLKTYCKNELCITGNPIHCILNRCKKGSLTQSIVASAEHQLRKISGLMNKVDKFICASQAMLELAVRSGIPEEKLIKIANFMDNTYLHIQPEYTNKGYFLYVGRLNPEKGVHYLLKAMQYLPEAKLHIVGTGYDEDYLKNLAKKSNLNNVEFFGQKTGKDLEKEYKGCIANVQPCNWFEAFGLTSIESFVHGKPTIASRVGGIPEIIDDGINGILIEPGNIDELVNAMKNLLSNNELVIQMGKNGRAKTQNVYNSSIHYEKLLNVYKSVIYTRNKGD